MASAPRLESIAEDEVDYPESDSKPMAETQIHRRNLTDLIELLERLFEDDPHAYVSGNMFVYERGNRYRSVAPDVFLVRGVDDRDRRRDVYKTWEDKGIDLVIELTSKSTKKEDLGTKFDLYRDVLQIPELFLFDPLGEYLKPSLRGYRLVDGQYVAIPAVDGRLPSLVIGGSFAREDEHLRLFGPDGRPILTHRESGVQADLRLGEERRSREAAERERRAEAEAKDAETLRANREKRRADKASAEAESLRREIEELKRQLERNHEGGAENGGE